jgi:hypothetical protein
MVVASLGGGGFHVDFMYISAINLTCQICVIFKDIDYTVRKLIDLNRYLNLFCALMHPCIFFSKLKYFIIYHILPCYVLHTLMCGIIFKIMLNMGLAMKMDARCFFETSVPFYY